MKIQIIKVPCIVSICIAIFLIIIFSCSTDTGTQQSKVDPLKYVDPFICTEGDNGQLYPGATYPFGLIQLSPETEGNSHVGYYYEDQFIEGFSHLRIGGAGSHGKGGGLLIKPGIGNFSNEISGFREKYIKQKEEASPGYYKTELESGIEVELTVTPHTGFHKYTFPAEKKKGRYVVIDLSHSYVGMLDAQLEVKNNKEITGMIKPTHNSKGSYHRLYFAIVSDTPFEGFTSWEGSKINKNEPVCKGNKSGIWLYLPEDGSDIVKLKVGMSPISKEQAMIDALNEIKGWDFEKVRNETALAWKKKLSKAEVKGGSKEFKTLFYTHLYHSYLLPSISSSTSGTYMACNQPDTLFYTKNTAPDFDYYSTWTIWDDFRKYSLINLLEPQIGKNIARSLVDFYKHYKNGDKKYWPTPNIRMEFASSVIMDAFNKGLGDFDHEAALKGMIDEYERSESSNVSAKLEKAYHAYTALEMAKKLGKTEEIKTLTEAANAYKLMWCPQQKDNQGNERGFFTPNGKPVPDVEVFEKYVYEGNLWHYRWFVLHDIDDFAELRGGKELLANDLEYFFENNFYMQLNEPDIHCPYLFDVLGKPYLTQKWVRTFSTKKVVQLYHNHGSFQKPVVSRIYRTDPKGYIESMDDDGGAMASWFVMSAMGLFQIDMAKPVYLIGSPLFPELILHLDNGNDFTIKANNVSEDNFYIQSAKLNRKKFNQAWIDYKTLMKGGILEFEMGPEPNKQWGTRSLE